MKITAIISWFVLAVSAQQPSVECYVASSGSNQYSLWCKVINGTPNAITSFTLGENYFNGLTVLNGVPPLSIGSPGAWTNRLVLEEESDKFAIKWTKPSGSAGIPSGGTLDGFKLQIPASDSDLYLTTYFHLRDSKGNHFSSPVTRVAGTPPIVVQIFAREEAPWETNHFKPRIKIKNLGPDTLKGFSIRYIFTTDFNRVAQLEKWFSPNCDTSTAFTMGQSSFDIKCPNVNVAPNAIYPDDAGFVFGLHYSKWEPWDKTNDWSAQGLTSQFMLTDKLPVFDGSGKMIGGTSP